MLPAFLFRGISGMHVHLRPVPHYLVHQCTPVTVSAIYSPSKIMIFPYLPPNLKSAYLELLTYERLLQPPLRIRSTRTLESSLASGKLLRFLIDRGRVNYGITPCRGKAPLS